MLRGLKSKSANGSIGVVLGGLQQGKDGRYPVSFSIGGKERKAAVKRSNILQILPFVIERKSGEREEFEEATAIWNFENSLYAVSAPGQDAKIRAAKTASSDELKLPDGCRVRVVGLVKAAKLNDKFAMVCGFDEASTRYIIDFGIPGQKRVKIRAANLRVE